MVWCSIVVLRVLWLRNVEGKLCVSMALLLRSVSWRRGYGERFGLGDRYLSGQVDDVGNVFLISWRGNEPRLRTAPC
jgi:hypothetical protein